MKGLSRDSLVVVVVERVVVVVSRQVVRLRAVVNASRELEDASLQRRDETPSPRVYPHRKRVVDDNHQIPVHHVVNKISGMP